MTSQDPGDAGDITLRLLQVGAGPQDETGAMPLLLRTSRGDINAVFHPVEGGTAALICVSGAMGGVDGPAGALYPALAVGLAPAGVSVLRLDYRQPNVFEECVADVLAGCSFLKGIGASSLALVGHSFGAAVVIKAGELAPIVVAVCSMSPQLHGTRQVENLGKPLLLIHGAADTVLDHEASEDVYRRAADPKQIVLLADTGHGLMQSRKKIEALLLEWLPARFAGEPMESGRSEWLADDTPPFLS
ncbi:MAG: alpha/beta hydrolase [Dehalococcoidia bacterium]|nr:alpha/beta hydrolase [Dehalococcoidia bacterium]MCB9485428.1 alpha/beta hydrolase [Thermoflexaceae bacterium]